ncbi:MAG: hypothetical protein V2I65_02810 [Paracoccaceae bacterium]|jgi:hypothetical protein|nr:hypothetical protein [Paracoccaceae bacterium]
MATPQITPDPLSADDIAGYFTRSDGTFLCARWGRPLAPVVFGVTEESLGTIKGAIEAVASLAGLDVAETDPELGANLMLFFVRDWGELTETPGLDRLIPGLAPLVARLDRAEANQYRVFRFDEGGAIRACFAFVRMDAHMEAAPADALALTQAVQAILLWSDRAFSAEAGGRAAEPPLARTPEGHTVLRSGVASVIRAAYDPVLPDVARDPAHALRLEARLRRAS